MPMVDIKLDGEWDDLEAAGDRVIRLTNSHPLRIAVLDKGIGLPAVQLRIDLPDGRIVLYETTARMWVGIAKTLKANFPML